MEDWILALEKSQLHVSLRVESRPIPQAEHCGMKGYIEPRKFKWFILLTLVVGVLAPSIDSADA